MTDNMQVNRSKINYIHARDYFPPGEIEQFRPWIEHVNWIPMKFGHEIENIHLIFPNIDVIMGKMVGDFLEVDRSASGTFRRTLPGIIHFEDFDSLDDWRFVVACDANMFKTYSHVHGYKHHLEYVADESEGKPELAYLDDTQWKEEAMIKMQPNDVLFYRPWLYHSFQDGILHYYKLKVI